MKKAFWSLLTISMILIPFPVYATWDDYGIYQRIKNADIVVVGQIVSRETIHTGQYCRNNANEIIGEYLREKAEIQIERVLKGDASLKTVFIIQKSPKSAMGVCDEVYVASGAKGVFTINLGSDGANYWLPYPLDFLGEKWIDAVENMIKFLEVEDKKKEAMKLLVNGDVRTQFLVSEYLYFEKDNSLTAAAVVAVLLEKIRPESKADPIRSRRGAICREKFNIYPPPKYPGYGHENNTCLGFEDTLANWLLADEPDWEECGDIEKKIVEIARMEMDNKGTLLAPLIGFVAKYGCRGTAHLESLKGDFGDNADSIIDKTLKKMPRTGNIHEDPLTYLALLYHEDEKVREKALKILDGMFRRQFDFWVDADIETRRAQISAIFEQITPDGGVSTDDR
jgi:hypothetical protein